MIGREYVLTDTMNPEDTILPVDVTPKRYLVLKVGDELMWVVGEEDGRAVVTRAVMSEGNSEPITHEAGTIARAIGVAEPQTP